MADRDGTTLEQSVYGRLIRAAARAPIGLKTSLFQRAAARLCRMAGAAPGELVDTNLGLDPKLRCRIPLAKTNYVFGRPANDPAERAALTLARELSRDCAQFVDVGANEGLYTLQAGVTGGGRLALHCFEPDDALRQRLTQNLADNGVAAVVNPTAVSDSNGAAPFFRNITDDASGSLTSYFSGRHATEIQEVKTVALAGYFAERGILDAFVKIDVEGAGDQAWSGAAPAADRIRYLLIEILAPEVEKALPTRIQQETGFFGYYIRDYDLVQYVPDNYVYVAPFWNWLFCRLDPQQLSARLKGQGFRVHRA